MYFYRLQSMTSIPSLGIMVIFRHTTSTYSYLVFHLLLDLKRRTGFKYRYKVTD